MNSAIPQETQEEISLEDPESWRDGPPEGRFDETWASDEPATGTRSRVAGNGDAGPAPPWGSYVLPAPSAWFETPPPRREWLLRDSRRPQSDGVFPLGKVGLLVAEGGAGKTTALLQLGIAIATGTSWLRTFTTSKQGRVLLLLGEEEAEEVHRRLYNAGRDTRTPPAGSIVVAPLAGIPCSMLERGERGDPLESRFARWLCEYAKANGPWDLICVDPLSRFAGLDAEIDNAHGTRFVQSLESLSTLTGASVLASHHTAKAFRVKGAEVSSSAARGSSSLTDGVRWVATLGVERAVAIEDADARERLGEVVTLSFTKSNYSRRADTLSLRRAEGGALVPLDDVDQGFVAVARDVSASKRAAKDAERAAKLEHERAERAAKEAARLAEAAAAHEQEKDALLAILSRRPGIAGRDLRAEMRASLGACSNDRTDAAVRRFAGWIRTEAGPNNSTLHYLAEAFDATA